MKENGRCDKKRHEPLTLEQMQEALVHYSGLSNTLFQNHYISLAWMSLNSKSTT